MADQDEAEKLFGGVLFTILPSDELNANIVAQLKRDLIDHGAEYVDLLPSGQIENLANLSHIISTHADFPQYDETLEFDCDVVKPSWVDQSIVKNRQVQARQHSPDPALIFQNVVVAYGDLPQGDRDAITAGVMAMGGMFSSHLTKLVTHVVSLTEDSEKIRVIKEKNLAMKVVLPHWFDDCLRLGRKISEGPYILPNPRILAGTSFTERGGVADPDMADAKSAEAGLPPRLTPPPSSPDEPATPRKNLTVFMDSKIFFSADLDIAKGLAKTLSDLVKRSGGEWCDNVEECTVYVGQYRETEDYVTASRLGKQVGNLVWFYSVIMRNRWSDPKRKLLHYPVPKDGIPGFKDMRISLSNYTGDARVYLENLIRVAGGEFTKTMKQDNTHLVTAHKRSEKCEAAYEWNINVINHLWLEDSYAKCRVQSLTSPRYTTFPSHTNLSEVVGQTPIDIDRMEDMYFPNEAANAVKVQPKPSPQKTVRTYPAGTNGAVTTPLAVRRPLFEEENGALTNSRASKIRATAELEKAAEDIAAFERERKRKGGVTHGNSRKRPSENGANDEDPQHAVIGDEETASRAAKKLKTAEIVAEDDVPVRYRMLVTGDDRWVKKHKKEAADKKALSYLGVQMVTNPLQCNLLVAPKILRTKKFVTALSAAPEVVSTNWLDKALDKHVLDDVAAFPLVDRAGEQKFGFDLETSLKRAAINRRRLLHGWTIYITDQVQGGFETFKEIVEANGGTALLYKGRTGVQLPRRRLNPDEDPDAGGESQHQGGSSETDYVYLVSGQSEDDMKVWPVFRKLAEKQDLQARIVKTDWLLFSALAQKIEWDEKWAIDEDSQMAAAE